MSHHTSTAVAAPAEAPVAVETVDAPGLAEPDGPAQPSAQTPSGRRQRGLATVEYAIGILLILTIIGVMIAAAQQGWFDDLVKQLFGSIFRLVIGRIAG